MSVLIIKLGAAGDVVRTTPLLRRLDGPVSWLTAKNNLPLLKGIDPEMRCVSWEDRGSLQNNVFSIVINLEDSLEVATYISTLDYTRLWGAQLGAGDKVVYTEDSQCWFDLSIVSRHGRRRADQLKLANRSTYQELIFQGLELRFSGETYVLPSSPRAQLSGDVAIATEAGSVWPMKKWAYYEELKRELEAAGLTVNTLERRRTLLEHLADVQGHRCLVSGDSLPMHLALGSGVRCVSIFTCTSPWEIYGYGLQRKIVSPLLKDFFYKREYDLRATTAISIEEVMDAVTTELDALAINSR